MGTFTFKERIQKTYTKKDLEKASGLKNKAQLQKRMDKLDDIYKVDVKKFQKILTKVKELHIDTMVFFWYIMCLIK
ncbi:hypothetical protein MXL20_02265 [Staphylococcus pseudoxylosus]|uniref:hypothetical protein n=1 Tax=Staphylococcus pseudoxylosus TaxID=2282419 RepID=UPI002DB91F62|nr:hypothetical protein [Staphylococcus pseudoxylosus]MEB6331822.1 hypothetical protein [Staphylococcus pseudoxylosus]